MQVYLRIICANQEVSFVKQRVAKLFSHLESYTITEETIVPYWKNENCSVVVAQFHCVSLDLAVLKTELQNISGNAQVNVIQEENSIDLSCYAALPEILAKPGIAFVACYISLQ